MILRLVDGFVVVGKMYLDWRRSIFLEAFVCPRNFRARVDSRSLVCAHHITDRNRSSTLRPGPSPGAQPPAPAWHGGSGALPASNLVAEAVHFCLAKETI